MIKKYKHIIFLLVASLLFLLVSIFTPKPVDWRFTYSKDDKIPHGNFLIFNHLNNLFPGKTISVNHRSFYESFHKQAITNKNFIIITEDFDPQKLELAEFLRLANMGNRLFIACQSFRSKIFDTLSCRQEIIFDISFKKDTFFSLSLHTPPLDSMKSYTFNKKSTLNYLVCDSTHQTLGTIQNENPSFIRIPFGKGAFFVHTMPYVFTNINMLKVEQTQYIANALSHLPESDIIWDEYYKPYRNTQVGLLGILYISPGLRFGYLSLIIGLAFYFIFESKRKQRIIPVIQPPVNSSLDFIRTVGRLYSNNRNNKDILEKKYKYFAEMLRSKFYLDATIPTMEVAEKLAEKSGVEVIEIKAIFNQYLNCKELTKISDSELLNFNQRIESFNHKISN